MPATRGAFSQLLAPGLFSVIYEDLEMHPEEYSQTYNVYPSTMAYEEDQLVAGLGTVPQKPEGTPIALDEPIQGGSLRYTHTAFGLGFQVTREMWDDDKYGIMQRVSTDFAGGIRQTIEAAAASTLVGAFATTTTIDGGYLCGSHNLLGGGSYSNVSATNAALSVTLLQELTLIFEKAVNERGILKRMLPEDALIPVDLQFKAGEILHSAYKPYTGTNEVNVMQGRFTPRVNHYLTVPSQVFLLAARKSHTLKFYWRTQPEFDSQDDFFTKGANYSCFFRFSNGATYWHGIAGSNGA